MRQTKSCLILNVIQLYVGMRQTIVGYVCNWLLGVLLENIFRKVIMEQKARSIIIMPPYLQVHQALVDTRAVGLSVGRLKAG